MIDLYAQLINVSNSFCEKNLNTFDTNANLALGQVRRFSYNVTGSRIMRNGTVSTLNSLFCLQASFRSKRSSVRMY